MQCSGVHNRASESDTSVRFTKNQEKRSSLIVDSCFNSPWLNAKAENDPEGKTNREVQMAVSTQVNEVDRRVDALQVV